MANVRSGIDALLRQAAQDQQTSGKDWCPDTPPRRPGEPCKTASPTHTALQQSVTATLSASLTARDTRCSHYVPVYNAAPAPGANLLGLIDPTRQRQEFVKPQIKDIGPDTGGTLNLFGATAKADGTTEASGVGAVIYHCLP
jgi:hypothetical protein